MKRRDFIRSSVLAGLGGSFLWSAGTKVFSKEGNATSLSSGYDLVAVKNGEPDTMFDKAIEAMGGMGAFIRKGQTVVVKPNIGWDAVPERAANTNPLLVKRIIQHCFQAGAKEVYVFDNTCDNWINCYKNSGIEKAAKDAGAKVVPGNTESYYQQVTVNSGKKLKNTKVHELILSSDVFINVPILKSHGSANLTMSMKNLMGVVWNRKYWHLTDLQQCIADYASYPKRPTLNIVDAYRVMIKNGPRGTSVSDVNLFKSLILSRDMVAADTAATKLFGMDTEKVPYLKMATDLKVGTMDLSTLNIARIDM